MGVQGVAPLGKWALGALGRGGRAQGSTKVHHRLVEVGSAVAGQQLLRQCGKLLLGCRGVDRRLNPVVARQHAIGIAVDGGMGQPEGKCGNGGRRVVAHTLQTANLLIIIGKTARRHNLLGGSVQVARTAIVAQPLPQTQHLVFAGGSKTFDSGKLLHEPLPVGSALGNARLLQDDLAQPNGVGVGGVPPRQVAAVVFVPLQQGCCERV